jgi:hypothetical protein
MAFCQAAKPVGADSGDLLVFSDLTVAFGEWSPAEIGRSKIGRSENS